MTNRIPPKREILHEVVMIVLFQEFIDYKILKKRPFDTTRFNACRIVDFK